MVVRIIILDKSAHRVDVSYGLIVKIAAAGDIDDPNISYIVDIHESRYNARLIGNFQQIERRAGTVGMFADKIIHVAYLDRSIRSDRFGSQ